MPQASLEHLHAFVADADTVNVLMVAEAEHSDYGEVAFEVQRLNMSQQLAERFRDIVLENATNNVGESRALPYSTGYKLDRQELFYIDLDEDPSTADTMDFIESVTEPAVFTKEEGFTERLAFYSIVFENMDGTRAAFYRKHAPKNQLSRGFIARFVDNQFEELEPQSYLFDDKIDFFTWDGYLFIRGAYHFRLIFKHFEQLQREVKENVERVIESVPIANDQEFLSACLNQPQMVSKVARVANQPYLSDITIDDIKETIQEFELDVEILTVDGHEKLIFDASVQQRWVILKMLDDDYLGSVLTNRKYEANSKSVRSGE